MLIRSVSFDQREDIVTLNAIPSILSVTFFLLQLLLQRQKRRHLDMLSSPFSQSSRCYIPTALESFEPHNLLLLMLNQTIAIKDYIDRVLVYGKYSTVNEIKKIRNAGSFDFYKQISYHALQ